MPTVTTIRRDPQRLLPKWLQITTIVILMLCLLPVLYMLIISISPDLGAAAGKLCRRHSCSATTSMSGRPCRWRGA
jgi:hypothetical protein